MKKLKQTVVTLAALLAPIAMAPLTSAVGTCANGYTGPDSNNLCTSTTTYECSAVVNNTVTIRNDNTQVAVTGGATSGSNTSSGGAQTGSATNANGVTFNVIVNNEVCTATATVPATPSPTPVAASTPTPVVTAGQGAVAVTAPNKTVPRALANTSGDVLAGYVAASVVALAGTLGVSRVALNAYSRYKA